MGSVASAEGPRELLSVGTSRHAISSWPVSCTTRSMMVLGACQGGGKGMGAGDTKGSAQGNVGGVNEGVRCSDGVRWTFLQGTSRACEGKEPQGAGTPNPVEDQAQRRGGACHTVGLQPGWSSPALVAQRLVAGQVDLAHRVVICGRA